MSIHFHGVSRRAVLAAIGAGAASTLPAMALAQPTAKWSPSSRIKMVVPYPAGGGTDVLARLVSTQIGNDFGQPIVIENRPGANGIVGTNLVYGSPPDGQTLLFAAADFISIAPHVSKKTVKFEPTQFAPIALIAKMGFILVSRACHDARDLPDAVE